MEIKHETKIKYGIDHACTGKTRSRVKGLKNLKMECQTEWPKVESTIIKYKDHEKNGKLFIKLK